MHGEQITRFVFFLGVLMVVAVWEVIFPRRQLTNNKGRRWLTNLSLVAIDTVVARFFLPVLPVGMAIMAQQQGWGILNIITLPSPIKIVLTIVAFDLVIYLQHVLFHFLPTLWASP